jgi:1-acyl-sn-glycerol-3-phosphate acyltransferase
MAIQFGYPITPMSIVGAYEFSRKGSWLLYPSKITVYMHETIDTKGLSKDDFQLLMNRVHEIVSHPIDEHYGFSAPAPHQEPAGDKMLDARC